MQASTVNYKLSRRSGSTLPRRMHREKNSILRKRFGNVYENKGPLWKKWELSGNVIEKRQLRVYNGNVNENTGS